MHPFRSHTCAELNRKHVGQAVRLSGWVHRIRDHGGVLFVDLRDHYGITQVLCDSDSKMFAAVGALRSEFCIRVNGEVRLRAPDLANPKLPTGEVEVFINDAEVLGAAGDLPLNVFGDTEYPEETRLKHRYLDLRRAHMQRNMVLRADVIAAIRQKMWARGFREYQTPLITASSPEGARDFLVPSRQHPGKFYALPQAPQIFKQMIMMSGFDSYFQIAPCFRDEDPRADRSPTDFYQLDLEMSFVEQEDVFATLEPVIKEILATFGGDSQVDNAWPRISYSDAMLWYGTDKPDLRNPIRMQRVCKHFHDSGFAIFAQLLKTLGNEVRAIPAKGGGSRRFCDRMNAFAQAEGLPGMGYIIWRQGEGGREAAGPLAKNIGPERCEAIRQQLDLDVGDAAFFLGGKPASFEPVAAKARIEVGDQLNLSDTSRFALAWIVDFPLFSQDPATGSYDFEHNPFSMPQGGLDALEGDPLAVTGFQYDLACNGYELASGAIRNHRQDIMYRMFDIAGHDADAVQARFGGLLGALAYGPPPHGGCAVGIDRLIMLLAGTTNIREVIMFPMNQRAEDHMLGAPSAVEHEQLVELGLQLRAHP